MVAGGALLVAVGLAAIVLWPMDPTPYRRMSASGEMLDRDGRLLHAFLNEDEQWCFPRPLDDISPHLVAATVATEDGSDL